MQLPLGNAEGIVPQYDELLGNLDYYLGLTQNTWDTHLIDPNELLDVLDIWKKMQQDRQYVELLKREATEGCYVSMLRIVAEPFPVVQLKGRNLDSGENLSAPFVSILTDKGPLWK